MSDISPIDVQKARVTIKLGDNDVVLKPSPAAILGLSEKYDGFEPLLAAVRRFRVQAAVDIVLAGAGAEGKAARALADQVVDAGMIDMLPSLVDFIMILANGGRRRSEEEDDKGKNPPGK